MGITAAADFEYTLWNLDVVEEPLDDLFRVDLFGLGLIADHDAVPQYIGSDRLDVFRGHVSPSAHECVSAGGAGKEYRRSRGCPVFDEVDHVLEADLLGKASA